MYKSSAVAEMELSQMAKLWLEFYVPFQCKYGYIRDDTLKRAIVELYVHDMCVSVCVCVCVNTKREMFGD